MKISFGLVMVALLCFIPVSYAQDNAFKETIINSVEPESISIIQLIANGEKYENKLVRIIGFVRFEFEGNAVYLTQEDYEHDLTSNGLWISLSEDFSKSQKDIKQFDKKYCLVEGVFTMKNKGHMGLWSGAVEDIRRLQIWR